MKFSIVCFAIFFFSIFARAGVSVEFSSPKQGESISEEMLIKGKISDFTPGIELFFGSTQILVNKDGSFETYLELANSGKNEFQINLLKDKKSIYRRMIRVWAVSQQEKIDFGSKYLESGPPRLLKIVANPPGVSLQYEMFDLGEAPTEVYDLSKDGELSIYKEGYDEIRKNVVYPAMGIELKFALVKSGNDAPKLSIKEGKVVDGYYQVNGKIEGYKASGKTGVLIISEPDGSYRWKEISKDGTFEWTYQKRSQPGEVYFRYTLDGKTGLSNKVKLKYLNIK